MQKFYSLEKGDIKINNTDIDQLSVYKWRSIVGFVPQNIKLFSGSLIHNIHLGATNAEVDQVIEFCRSLGFSKYFEKFPQGYFTFQLLLSLKPKICTILVTHQLKISSIVDRARMLNAGNTREFSSPDEL